MRLAAGLTLDQVAVAARARGLKWSESRVADFESGRVAMNLATLFAFSLAIEDLGCGPGTLPELVQWVTPIQINDSLELWTSDLVNLFEGQPVRKPKRPRKTLVDGMDSEVSPVFDSDFEQQVAYYYIEQIKQLGLLHRVSQSSGATELRVCRALGISTMLLTHLSVALWDRSFSQERDKRAGPDANAQKRGQITRHMQSELEAAMEAAVDGNDK